MKPSWLSCWPSFFSRARFKSIALGKSATTPFFLTGILKSKNSGWKKPSLCLQLAFLALAISGFLSLETNEAAADPEIERLLKRGWQWADPAPCENILPGKFYEIESEASSAEFYAVNTERFLAPSGPWPEPPAVCREIPNPSFIQEVK